MTGVLRQEDGCGSRARRGIMVRCPSFEIQILKQLAACVEFLRAESTCSW